MTRAGCSVKYGKIEIVAADADIDTVIDRLDKLLTKHGYPEMDKDVPDLETKELLEEDDELLPEYGEAVEVDEDLVEDEDDVPDEAPAIKGKPAPWMRKANG